MDPLSPATLELLRQVSTATVTTQLFKRGLRNVYMQGGVKRLTTPSAGTLVGPAYTLRNIPSREDIDQMSVFEDTEHPQRKSIEVTPAGHVLVVDARGEQRAACAGNILMARLQVRGVAGFVADGPVRDSHEMARMDFPVFCTGGSAPLNLVHHHAVERNVPIACGGVAVYPGDLILGDAEGVTVIPRHLAEEVARDAYEQELLEEFVIARIQAGAALPGNYPANAQTKAEFEVWKKARSAR